MADQGVHMPEALTYPENYYDIAQTMRPGAGLLPAPVAG